MACGHSLCGVNAEVIAQHMAEALAEASRAIGLSDPNPRVGCVIADSSGCVVGRGHTQQAGGPHAEVMALRDALSRGGRVHGSTAYVTLEPCCHHGRTPPCCDALIAAGVRCVVVALRDANPAVAGLGISRLQQAGVDVIELPSGALRAEAERMNVGFLFRMRHARPWIRMKAALSLDGKMAMENGVSQWITGEAARVDGHAWRRRAGAVLTGVGTVLADNPRLDVRLVPTKKQPLRVIVDSAMRTPVDARMLGAGGRTLIYYAQENAERKQALESRGAELKYLPDSGGRVNVRALVDDLGRNGINELHVEAGRELNGTLIREGLADELLLYIAPRLLGPGRDLAALALADEFDKVPDFLNKNVEQVGDDIRITAIRRDRLHPSMA